MGPKHTVLQKAPRIRADRNGKVTGGAGLLGPFRRPPASERIETSLVVWSMAQASFRRPPASERIETDATVSLEPVSPLQKAPRIRADRNVESPLDVVRFATSEGPPHQSG